MSPVIFGDLLYQTWTSPYLLLPIPSSNSQLVETRRVSTNRNGHRRWIPSSFKCLFNVESFCNGRSKDGTCLLKKNSSYLLVRRDPTGVTRNPNRTKLVEMTVFCPRESVHLRQVLRLLGQKEYDEKSNIGERSKKGLQLKVKMPK